MKVAVYFNGSRYDLFEPNEVTDKVTFNFIGYLDLPIEKPKKTVVKEAEEVFSSIGASIGNVVGYSFPPDAKNIKPPTYEIEE